MRDQCSNCAWSTSPSDKQTVGYHLQIDTCHLPLQGSCTVAAADLQHPLKGVQGGEQK